MECTVFICADPKRPVAAGKFALDGRGQGHFVYGASFLKSKNAFAFDPVNLPLSSKQLRVPVRDDDSFGVLSDAGPNTWGRRITASICKARNTPVPSNPVEWLLSSYHYGAGCFGFSVDPSIAPVETILPVELSVLDQKILDAIDNVDAEKNAEILRIILPGASLGGARPKTVVMHDGVEHIAKFNRNDDLFDVSTVEYASMRLAFAANIDVPDYELVTIGDRSAFIVKRFDRTPNGGRRHYISAHSLLNVGKLSGSQVEYKTKFSYAGIAEVARAFNPEAVSDSRQLFRRMIFNILIGNVDDHLRNHGFLMTSMTGQYRLSPAFDLLPHLDSSYMPQSIGVGALGAASTLINALTQCERFFLEKAAAKQIISEVRDVVSNWRSVFLDSGVSRADIHRLSACFSAVDNAERIAVQATSNEDTPSVDSPK